MLEQDLFVEFLLQNVFVLETISGTDQKESIARLIFEEIPTIIAEHEDQILLEKNMFLHLINMFVIRWDYCNLKDRKSPMPRKWIDFFLTDINAVFLINNLINISLLNKTQLKNSVLVDLIDDLKVQLRLMGQDCAGYKHYYKLLLNILQYDIKPDNIVDYSKDLTLLDMSIFNDLHDCSKMDLCDLLLVKNTSVKIYDTTKEKFEITIRFKCPDINYNPLTLLCFKTGKEEFLIKISSNGIFIIQQLRDNSEQSHHNDLIAQEDFPFHEDLLNEFQIRVLGHKMIIMVNNEQTIQTKLSFGKEISVFIGDSQPTEQKQSIVVSKFVVCDEDEHHKLNLNFKKIDHKISTFDSYNIQKTGLFVSMAGSLLSEAYRSINFFNMIVSLIEGCDSNTFFRSILPILLSHKEIMLKYISCKEGQDKKTLYYDVIFFNINKKIDDFSDVKYALSLIFQYNQNNSYTFTDYSYIKNIMQFVFNWKCLDKEGILFILSKFKAYFEFGTCESRLANAIWLENHIDILDCLLDHLEFWLKKYLEDDIEVYNFLKCMLTFCFESFNSNIISHILQHCVYQLSIPSTETLKLTEIIIEVVINTISLLHNLECDQAAFNSCIDLSLLMINCCITNCDLVPTMLFEKCLFLYLGLNKRTNQTYMHFVKNGPIKLFGYALSLNSKKNFQYLNSFCEVLLLSSFDFHNSSASLVGCTILANVDSDFYWKNINKEFTEVHLLLIKILSACSLEIGTFMDRYSHVLNILSQNKNYINQMFDNNSKIIMSLVGLSMDLNVSGYYSIDENIANFFFESIIYLEHKIYNKLITILNVEIHETTNINFTQSVRVWLALKILPLVFKKLSKAKISTFYEPDNKANLKETGMILSNYFLNFKVPDEFIVYFLDSSFLLFETKDPTSSINFLIAKCLNLVCYNKNVLNDKLMTLIIENQHLIISFDVFFSYFIQFISFTILNYQLTSRLKEEKFAFINILLNKFSTSLKNNSIYAITGFIGKDYIMKRLLEKLSLLESDNLMYELSQNQHLFERYLTKISKEQTCKEFPYEIIYKQKAFYQNNSLLVAEELYKQENVALSKIKEYILNAESKNKQIRKADYQDSIESAYQNIQEYLSFFKVLQNCFLKENLLTKTMERMSLYRGFNKTMQKKILAPKNVGSCVSLDYSLFFNNDLGKDTDYENKLTAFHEESTNDSNDLSFSPFANTSIFNQNRRILKKLSLNETIKNIWNACIVTGINIENGVLILTDNNVLFYKQYYYRAEASSIVKRSEMTTQEEGSLIALNFENSKSSAKLLDNSTSITQDNFIKIGLSDISFCLKRVFVFKDIACEFLNKHNESFFFTFVNKSLRDKFYGKIHKSFFYSELNFSNDGNMFGHVFEAINIETNDIINKNGIGKFSFSSKISSVVKSLISEAETLDSLSKDWQSGKVSNFFYLLAINFYAGRSFNDITQYPIFPWVISDYESESIDLSNKNSFRDLSKPMGAQSEKRLKTFLEMYDAVEELNDKKTPPFHYGTHYSSAMIVASYMIRLEPFTSSFKILQGGNFGPSDRVFNSIERAWKSASTELTTDVRELIPEFFFLPDFLENVNHMDFGVSQNGTTVDNVNLPKWCYNKSAVFIQKNIEALESNYVSENLNNWIDLIFGFKQRGQCAKDSVNVFNKLSYSGSVKVDNLIDTNEVDLVTNIIHNFGQTPLQLFQEPHLQKDIIYFNKNIITIAAEYKKIESLNKLQPVMDQNSNLVSVSAVIEIDSDCVVEGNVYGVIKKKLKRNNEKEFKNSYGYAHIKAIKKLLYSDNFDILVSLDSDGVCLKWILSTMSLINKVVSDTCESVVFSNYSGNMIFEHSATYTLSTLNGKVLNSNIFENRKALEFYNFVDISPSVKKRYPYLIDYIIVLEDARLSLYEIVLNEQGEYQLENKDTQINTKEEIPTDFQAMIILDDCNNNQLHLSLKFETRNNELIQWFEF